MRRTGSDRVGNGGRSDPAIPLYRGAYSPNIIAEKDFQCRCVEIKAQPEKMSFEQLQNVVEAVNRQAGWRFILITPQDAAGSGELPVSPKINFRGTTLHPDWRRRANWSIWARRMQLPDALDRIRAFERTMRYRRALLLCRSNGASRPF